jgi:glycerophosphoryl diester phosphodiesterase
MRKIILFIVFVLLYSCTNEIEVEYPNFTDGSILRNSIPLSAKGKEKLEGIWKVTKGNKFLGEQIVLKWVGDTLSLFSGPNGVFMLIKPGSKGNNVFFEGLWRKITNIDKGLSRWVMSAENGGASVVWDTLSMKSDAKIILMYGNENQLPDQEIELQYDRPLSTEAIESKYAIIAHRGGGRTSDYLPAAENSIEIFKYAEQFGANGVEIDVKMSQDSVPFLYHDNTINLRLCKKGPLWGKIEDFTFPQIRANLQLINNETIPSLSEALEYIVNETNLKYVWLDMKSDKNDADKVAKIMKVYNALAKAKGRDLKIFMGLPTEDKIEHFKSIENHTEIPSLCELSVDEAKALNSMIWAPRWTQGTQDAEIDEIHADGRFAFTWTLDDPVYIKNYVTTSKFDGILTNYPSIVAYYHYIR